MRFLAPVLANLWLLLSAIGWGSLVCPLFPSTFSRIDRWAAIPLTGLGVQGLLLFLLGMARFTQLVILLVFGLGAILGLRWIWQELASTGRSSRNLGIVPIPLAVIGLVLLVTLVGGLSEPCGTLRTDDSIAYHYLGPKVWLRDGVIHPVFDESLTAFPATVEIQYAPLLAFGGPRGPAFFSVTSLVLMLLVVASLALRCGLSSPQAWWLLALVSAMPAVYRGLHGGMIDVIYACFLLMAARFALDAERPADFIVSGLFCGFAIGSKYTGLLAAPLLCLCVLLFPKNSPKTICTLYTEVARSGRHRCLLCGRSLVHSELDCGRLPDLSSSTCLGEIFCCAVSSRRRYRKNKRSDGQDGPGPGQRFCSSLACSPLI